MKRPTDLRTVLIVVGAAAFAATTGVAAAQSPDIRGTVGFAAGATIPKGWIAIRLEDPAIPDGARRRIAETRVASDGGSRAIAFAMTRPEGAAASPTLRIVARLERADGWLIARGSAPVDAGSSIDVVLRQAMY